MDIIGLPGVAAEAELMAAQADFLRRCGFRLDGPEAQQAPEIVFKVSNRAVLGGALDAIGISAEQFAAVCVVIDKKDKIGAEATAVQLAELGVSADAAAQVLRLLDTRGLDAVAQLVPADDPGLQQLRALLALADAAGFAHLIRVDLSVVRGLSYYTGTVWEVFDASGAMPRAIAGGGRYDRLAETLGGKPIPMVGFGFGDVVILEILAERKLLPDMKRGLDDVVFPFSPHEFAAAARVATRLRAQGRSVVVDYSERRFKHAIARAEADGAARLIILGADELRAGVVKVRLLDGSRTETTVAMDAI
jgi:histidyl-tRNA synthetase